MTIYNKQLFIWPNNKNAMFYGKDQLYFNLVNLMIQFIMFCEFTWLDIWFW